MKHLGQPHTHVNLGREPGPEPFFFHILQAAVQQDDGGMNHPVNPGIPFSNRFIGLLQRLTIGGVSGDIFGSGPRAAHPVQFGLDGRIHWPPSDPYYPRLIGTDHIFTPGFPDTTGAPNHHIYSLVPVQGPVQSGVVDGQ